MQKIDYEALSYSELSEEEKQIVDQNIKELDTKKIEGIQAITDIEIKKLYREQQILAGIQTKFNIELTNLSDNDGKFNEDKGFDFFKQLFLSLKKKLQRFISKENDEESFNINKIKDEFIDIKLELKLRSTKLKIMEENLRNHYVDIGHKILALDRTLQLNTDNGAISNDYEKRDLDIKRKNQINVTMSYLRGIRINIVNAILISESLAQQYEKISENYDENKILSLLQCMDEDGIIGNKDIIDDKNEIISIRFARLEKRINKLYLACESLYNISASRKTGFIELKQLKERLYKEYDNIIKTAKYDEYPKLENDIIREFAQIECNVEEYAYDTRKYAVEIIVRKIKKIYNSSNYKDFQNMDTEIKNVEAIEELLNYYSSYLETDLKKELKTQVITLKFNLYYRKQVELLIYGNEKNECIFVEDNLSNQEKEWFELLLKLKIKYLKNSYSNSQNYDNTSDILFEVPINQILYDRVLLERFIIMDMKYNAYDYINLLKAKIFNAHFCNIGNNPFKQEVYLTSTQIYNLGYGEYTNRNLYANRVNYSILVAVLKSIITKEKVSFIECETLYRRFGFSCNPIIFDIGQECIKIIFDQVKLTNEYFDIANSVIKRNKEKLEMPYCKIDFEGLLYTFDNDMVVDDNEFFKSVIAQRDVTLDSSNKKEFVYKQINYSLPCLRCKIPLERMSKYKSSQVTLVSVPNKMERYCYQQSHIWDGPEKYEYRTYIVYNLNPLWLKYKNDFEKLKLEVYKYYPNDFNSNAQFCIALNLNDISDLPIDYKKVQFLSIAEYQKIIKDSLKQKKWSRDMLVGKVNPLLRNGGRQNRM